jgi:hypothetical protein
MSTALPFPLPVAAYGSAQQRTPGEKIKVALVGVVGLVALGMFFSYIEASAPKKVHPTLRRVR